MTEARPDTHAPQAEPVDPGFFEAGGVIPGPPQRCPGCGEPSPEPVHVGSETNFFCHRCGTCWHIGMGYLWAVSPLTCPGCPRAAECRSVPTWLAESMTRVHHLADGSRVMIRPLLPSDRAALAAGFESLTPRSRRLRFFSAEMALSEAQLDYLVKVDYRNHFALAAFTLDEPDQPGIGVARFIRLADRPTAA